MSCEGYCRRDREKLQEIFRGNIAEDELKQINKTRQSKSQIGEGIISNNEKSYWIDGRKIQEILARALHRVCKVPIKETGNDFEDAKCFEERLDIEIQMYNLESRQIYKGKKSPTKVYILMSENHYDVISNIAGFTCANTDRNWKWFQRC